MSADHAMDLSDLRPSKIVAVHLNYRSRAEERGRTPADPSYFLKPPSSLAADGDEVVRAQGCELLCYEGEIAIVIAESVRGVDPQAAAAAIGWVTAANDFGVYDMRWADRGSNLMAKGQDGFTPIGPRLVAAAELDLGDLTLRTRVNGETVQEDNSANLLFSFGRLVADLSRFMTLERGDVILTGTPANSRPVVPGDVVEVEIDGVGSIRNEIVAAEEPLAPYGAMPKATAEARGAALGATSPRPAVLSERARAALLDVATATLTVQLRKRGIANTFMGGLRPTRPGERLLGYAHTLRYVALREDVRDADTAELNAQKATIESLSDGEVLVIEARDEVGAGTIGDILATRAMHRGAAGVVTDGGVRDTPAIAGIELPTYYRASHAAVLGLLHFPLEDNVPITCAGVLVMPGDLIVGDAEGVMVIPAAMAEEVALDAQEQEVREAWSLERVEAGEAVRDVYPISPEREPEYEQWRARRRQVEGERK
jgi:2-keto-4-pentenoate hydratase/2-oxohepta-3-ene-1,7-dioic acid hydratase in catechol pathway/regulator of RNase E activity RraA